MRATAWNNGSHRLSGAGYGLKISEADRDQFFDRDWETVVFDFGGESEAVAALSDSFWRSCSELRSAEIGRWLRRHGLAPWPTGSPPRVEVTHAGGNRFIVTPPGG
jgi:hypothetical protein